MFLKVSRKRINFVLQNLSFVVKFLGLSAALELLFRRTVTHGFFWGRLAAAAKSRMTMVKKCVLDIFNHFK